MNPSPKECMLLFDAAAEALVMVCADDEESVTELTERLQAIAAWFDEADADHPSNRALEAVARFASGDTSAVAEIEVAYTDARARALSPRAQASGASASPQSAKSNASAAPMPLAGDEDLLRDFGVRAGEHLDDADERLLALESHPADSEAIDAIFRSFHTIKGMAGFLALDAISEHAHESESLIADARATATAIEPEAIEQLFAAVDTMRRLITDATGIGQATAAESESAQGEGSAAVSSRSGTVRIDESRLDRLLDTIGELVIAESMVSSSVRLEDGRGETMTHVERLDKITRELQSLATSLRMVPLKATFQRMARLVRDVSHRSGKPVDLVIEGEDTELDKEVVDLIADPLIHALRNAVDHGIETPAERVAAGKPETGRVILRAFHAGGAINIEVIDDGRGLDPERILARARERGLVAEDATLDYREILDLIFQPGFSTSDEVTDVSGRGVGMDVVRRTVDELRGRVELRSTPGEGCALSIRLPITLAIIDGMVARVAEERYVIPLLSIERSVRPTADQITTVAGRGEMLTLDDGLVPVVRLHRLFDTKGAEQDPTNAVVVITSDGGSRAGLLVCELLGQQQTVIKPLGGGLLDRPGITGGAIMPDGCVGLILDAAGLVRVAHGKDGV